MNELAATLLKASRHYNVMSGKVDDHEKDVTSSIAQLNAIDNSTTYPLLLDLFDARANGRIDSKTLAYGIDMVRGFLMRRFICGESSRGYGQMFVGAIPRESHDPIQELDSYLLQRGWPDKQRFETAFVRFRLYGSAYVRHVLEMLERSRGDLEQADLTNATIEHIMPQVLDDEWRSDLGDEADRIHAEWLHRPGNLTLSAHHPEYGNKSFAIKRKMYSESNIGITRELADPIMYPSWNEQRIKERGQRLASYASTIWIGPDDPLPPPPPPGIESICQMADAKGIGGPFRALRAAGERNGLYVRPAPNSQSYAMYAPPTNRAVCLLLTAATPKIPGTVRLWVYPKVFPRFYPISEQQALTVLGQDVERHLSPDEATGFIAKLDALFDEIRATPAREWVEDPRR